jgi:hypothetical protein
MLLLPTRSRVSLVEGTNAKEVLDASVVNVDNQSVQRDVCSADAGDASQACEDVQSRLTLSRWRILTAVPLKPWQ